MQHTHATYVCTEILPIACQIMPPSHVASSRRRTSCFADCHLWMFAVSLPPPIPRATLSLPLYPNARPVWEALRQSACPMELRVDLKATGASVSAQRGRVCERLSFLTKRKVEARMDGMASLGRVMTL